MSPYKIKEINGYDTVIGPGVKISIVNPGTHMSGSFKAKNLLACVQKAFEIGWTAGRAFEMSRNEPKDEIEKTLREFYEKETPK